MQSLAKMMAAECVDPDIKMLIENTPDPLNPLSLDDIGRLLYKDDPSVLDFINEFGVHYLDGKYIYYSQNILEKYFSYWYTKDTNFTGKFATIQLMVEHMFSGMKIKSDYLQKEVGLDIRKHVRSELMDIASDPVRSSEYIGISNALSVPVGDILHFIFIPIHFTCELPTLHIKHSTYPKTVSHYLLYGSVDFPLSLIRPFGNGIPSILTTGSEKSACINGKTEYLSSFYENKLMLHFVMHKVHNIQNWVKGYFIYIIMIRQEYLLQNMVAKPVPSETMPFIQEDDIDFDLKDNASAGELKEDKNQKEDIKEEIHLPVIKEQQKYNRCDNIHARALEEAQTKLSNLMARIETLDIGTKQKLLLMRDAIDVRIALAEQ